jgi:predicted DNA-binding protein (UPF0251 family)
MPRPHKPRRCRLHAGDRVFKPASIPLRTLQTVPLTLSELEAMRLCDMEGLDQEAAAQRMGVSRGTVQRLVKRGRAKVVGAILRSDALIIERGELHEDLYSDQ